MTMDPSGFWMQRTARLTACEREFGEDALTKVNRFAIAPLTKDDIIVRKALVANDQPDSYQTQFVLPALNAVAGLLPGCALMRNHNVYNSDDLPLGKWFDAGMEKRDAVNWASGSFYMIREPMSEALAARMDAGIVSEVSLSWYMERGDLKCSICGLPQFGDECGHLPGESYGGVTAVGLITRIDSVEEASLVWKGGQYGTRIELPDQKGEQRITLMHRIAAKRAAMPAPRGDESKSELETWFRAAEHELADFHKWWAGSHTAA